MPSTTSFKQGDVVLVPFPFTNLRTTKQRPALVVFADSLNRSRPDVAITSQIPVSWATDELRLAEEELNACGPPKSSIVRLGKIFTIHQGLVRKRFGRIPPRTLEQILAQLRGLLA